MSTEYSASIVVGYRFTLEEALEPFAKKVGEDRSHKEDRFDPKTGKKIGEEEIWDERAQTFFQHGKLKTNVHLDDLPEDEDEISEMDFIEKLAEKNGFDSVTFGVSSSDQWEVVFFPKNHPPDLTEPQDWGRLYLEGHLSWSAVCEMGKDLMELGKKLRKLGLKPGQPEIVLAATAS